MCLRVLTDLGDASGTAEWLKERTAEEDEGGRGKRKGSQTRSRVIRRRIK